MHEKTLKKEEKHSQTDGRIAQWRCGCVRRQLDTNSRLADRVDQIRVLKDLLERTAAALEREIGSLNDAKQNLEYALDQRVGLATHVTVDNLVSREGRRDGDIVEDVVDVELHKVAYCGAGWHRGSVAEWLACWTQAQKVPGSNTAVATLSGNSLRQTVHTHCASVRQSAKLVAALLRVAGVTAGLAESNGSPPSGL